MTETGERTKEKSIIAGREIISSLLALTTQSIEDFERGKSKTELDAHYMQVDGRLSRASGY